MTTINVGSSVFTIEGAGLSTGNFADGPGWVVIPSGTDSLTSVTPTQTTEGGKVVHGAMKNPMNRFDAPNGQDQGYDDRLSNSRYNASLSVTYPQSIAAGDVIVKAVSRLGINVADGSTQARGLYDEYNALFVLSEAPAAGSFAPAIYGWTGRGNPAPIVLSTDIDTIVAGLPSYDLAGIDRPTAAEMVAYADHFDPAYGRSNGTTRSDGAAYEPASVFKNFSNYGREHGAAIGAVGLHLIGNEATTQQKKTMLIGLISRGIQWGYPWFGVNEPFGGNGGHHQFHQLPVALAIKYAGLGTGFADIITFMPGNTFAQTFEITQAWLDANYMYHTDASKPEAFYRRTIQSVSGNNVTVSNPTSRLEVNGTKLKRESDGAFAFVTNSNGTNKVFSDGTLVLTGQPTPAFQVGDVVMFDFAVPPVVGDVDWDIRSSQGITNTNNFTPSWSANYRGLQNYTDDLICMKALECYVADFDYVKKYVELSNTPDHPTALNNWPDHEEPYDGHRFSEEFGNVYWDAIMNGGAVDDPTPADPTPGKRPVMSGRTIMVAGNGLPLIG